MRITLTGATGFIGSRLVRRWLEQGHELHVLGRQRGNLPVGVQFWEWARVRDSPPPDSLEGSDAVVNLAGEPVAQRWSETVKQRIKESRTLGTRQLVQAISQLKRKPAVLVNGSAVGYYGSRGDEILTEHSSPGDTFLAGVCVEWEQQANRAAELGVRLVCVRTGIVLGKEGGALAQMLTPFRLGVGGRLGSGRQWMPWLHIEDMLGLIDLALHTETVRGAMNACGPHPVTNHEFSQALAQALHRPALIPDPEFLLKLIFGEMAEILLMSDRVLPAIAQQAGYQFRFSQLPDALRDILR